MKATIIDGPFRKADYNIFPTYIQVHQLQLSTDTLKNIEAILDSVDLGKDSIAKLTVFVKNLDDFQSVNKAFEKFFNGIEYPARSTVEVSELPMGALIEIECIAIK